MFNKYPYTDFHEINLDWIIEEIKRLHYAYDDFKAVNTITNAGAWDITKQYSPWTVVSDNNAGYISLKPVPVGIDIHNAEYWGLIADYDILITDLSNRISALESDNISNKNRITTLEGSMSLIENKKYVFCSDSYGAMSTWVSNFVTYNNLSSDDYYDESQSAAAFEDQGNDQFVDQLERAYNTMGADIAKTITDILVVGGLNDTYHAYTDTTELWDAMDNFNTWAAYRYPNAKIHLAFVGMLDRDQTAAPGTDMQRIRYTILKYINYAGRLGWHYMTNTEYALHGVPGLMQADGIHPNNDGGERIAQYVSAAMNGGSADVKYYNLTQNLTLTPPANYTVSNTPKLTSYQIDNALTSFNIDKIELTVANVSTNFGFINVDLACSDLPFIGNTTLDTYVADTIIELAYDDGGTKYAMCPGTVEITGSHIHIIPKAFDFGSNNWLTKPISGIKTLTPAHFAIPTIGI